MAFKVIFFDFGDTLVHFKNSVYEFWAELLVKHGLSKKSVKALCKDIQASIRKEWTIRNGEDITWVKDEDNEREYWRAFYESVLEGLGVEAALGEVLAAFIDMQMNPNSWELFDDVEEALERFQSEGYVLGIISNAFPSAIKIFDEQSIDTYFNYYFWSYESYRDYKIAPKPDISEAGLYKFAIKTAGIKPENALFIDDRRHFVEGAINSGMKALLLDRENTHKDWKASLRITSLRDVVFEIPPNYKKIKVVNGVYIDGNADRNIIIIGDGNNFVLGQEQMRELKEADGEPEYLIDPAALKWLPKVNLKKQPFDLYVAEDEIPFSTETFVSPVVSIQSLLTQPKPFLIFGEKGSGKTTLANFLLEKCYPRNLSSRQLAFYYDMYEFSQKSYFNKPFEKAILKFLWEIFEEATHKFPEMDCKSILKWKSQVNQEEMRLGLFFSELNDWMMNSKFERLFFIVDRMDEIIGVNDFRKLDVLTPLLSVAGHANYGRIGFRFLLPSNIGEKLYQSKTIRADRMYSRTLKWSEELIIQLMERRLINASKDVRIPVHSLGELCEITDIDSRIAISSDRNPRGAIWLAGKLINTHCFQEDPPIKITSREWFDVYKNWLEEGRYHILGEQDHYPRGLHLRSDGQIYYYNCAIDLNPARARLLKLFIQNKGQFCTHDEIAAIIDGRVVPDAIRHLKNSLEKDFNIAGGQILGEQGKGYKLVDDQEGHRNE